MEAFKKKFTHLRTYYDKDIYDYEIMYTTCGKLNSRKDNAILVCHALTGNAYLTGIDPEISARGWWHNYVGGNKAIDTNKYFVICANALGGCHGSTGPSSMNVKTENRYAMSFPLITIQDMVKTQIALIDSLGIEKLFAVIGGSMGGMQSLVWALNHWHRVKNTIIIATSMAHSAMQIGFNEIGRQAIINDPAWNKGNYYELEDRPTLGLAVARMIGHITYLSEFSLHEKFGRKKNNRKGQSSDEFSIASYLQYQSERFIQRFDPNTYLYITKAVDLFDVKNDPSAYQAIAKTETNFLIVSFSSDWLYTSEQSREMVRLLKRSTRKVSYMNLQTSYGHDSFLIKNPEFANIIQSFLETNYYNKNE